MKITKSQRNNIILLIIVLVMIIPQTRQPLQVLLHKGLALFSPSVMDEEDQLTLADYDWQLVDQNGRPYNLKEAEGKLVFINFWATWCPPCIAEMPNMDQLYQSYKNEVVFLFVSNETQEVVSKFKEKHSYDFIVYSSQSPPPHQLETTAIPRTFLIDQDGKIVIDKTGAANWNSNSVKELLDNLLALQ